MGPTNLFLGRFLAYDALQVRTRLRMIVLTIGKWAVVAEFLDDLFKGPNRGKFGMQPSEASKD
jgi:hypothetical protein